MTRPALSLIAAVARNAAIGKNNELLWTDAEDQRHFRRVTMGCPVIMGRKTWESLPARFRPLPGRTNIVITHNSQWRAEGALVATSIDEALALAGPVEKVFVIGGAQIYALALAHADELLLTEIDADLPGDTFFPAWDRTQFRKVASVANESATGPRFSFVTYRRNQGD